MNKGYFTYAIKSIRQRKLRSWLTVIGIVIGIASIIALITVSQGLENAITEQFEMMGADKILVMPKGMMGPAGGATALSTDDVDTLESLSYFEWVSPFLLQQAKLEYKDEELSGTVIGLDTEDIDRKLGDYGITLYDGRYLGEDERTSVLIGYLIAEDFFKKKLRVKNRIKIENEQFKIVGILDEIGNPQDDRQMYIPIDTAREIFDKPDDVNMIELKLKLGLDPDTIAEKVERKLKKARDDENFEVSTSEQLLQQMSQILGIVQIVLAGIAAISLLVGGIGIMNSMYTSVLERTRQIGIMKAVGARNRNILMIFLIESGFLGLIGGFFGVVIGTAISYMVGFIASSLGFQLLKITIDYKLLIFGLLFAFIIGMISGVLPAYKASKLKPVDALRYE